MMDHKVGDWVTLNPSRWTFQDHTTIYRIKERKIFMGAIVGFSLEKVVGETGSGILEGWWVGESLLPKDKSELLTKLEYYEWPLEELLK